MKATIVIPTIREDSIKRFLKEWGDYFKKKKARVIVIEDNPKKTFKITGAEHYAWEDIEADLKENSWIIPRRTSAVRDYGFLKAVEEPTDMIVTLDDDCYPYANDSPFNDDFLLTHYYNLYDVKKLNRWFSTEASGKHVRGIPYEETESDINCVISHGFWLGTPDLDAVHQLSGCQDYKPYVGVVPRNLYFSMCSMNFAFKPEATPLVYQILNGEDPKGNKYPYNRFDDIWAGVIAKKVCDQLGLYIHTGSPLVWHDRASNPFSNLQKEAPGLKVNESFWKYIDKIRLEEECIENCYKEIADCFQRNPPDGNNYWSKFGCSMKKWLSEFCLRKELKNE